MVSDFKILPSLIFILYTSCLPVMEIVNELNYDCNYDLFIIAFTMKATLKDKEDRCNVKSWMQRLMRCNKTLDELRLRNDFLYYLALNVQEGKLRPPFNAPPGLAPLRHIAHEIPGGEDAMLEDLNNSKTITVCAENGGFLLPRPLPSVGTFCYLAVVNHEETPKN